MNQKTYFLAFCIMAFLFLATLAKAEGAYFSTLHVPAVTSEGNGVLTEVGAELIPGKGRVLLNTEPFTGIQTQNSERVAATIAKNFTGSDLSNKDIIITFKAEAFVIDGASAGAAMTAILIAAIENKIIRNDTSLTGAIQPDGTIGQVGSIFEKAQVAAQRGFKYFLIPKGQEIQAYTVEKVENTSLGFTTTRTITQYRNMTRYAAENWNMTVIEVAHITDVYDILIGNKNITRPIKISVAALELPAVKVTENSMPFVNVAKKQMQRASEDVVTAKKIFENTSIELDKETFIKVEQILQQAETEYEKAEAAFSANYLYGAANQAFRASVFSKSFGDAITYFSIKSDGEKKSFVELRKVQALAHLKTAQQEFANFKYYENDVGSYEWLASGQSRLAQAEMQSKELSKVPDIFFELALIEGWCNIATDIYGIAKETHKNILFNSTIFGEESIPLIKKLDSTLSTYSPAPPVGISWFNKISQLEFSKHWFVAAYIDSSIGHAKIESQRTMSMGNFANIAEHVQFEINNLETANSAWADLYKNQANLVLYYAKREQNADLLDDALTFTNEAKVFADLNKRVNSMHTEKRPLELNVGFLIISLFIGVGISIMVYFAFMREADEIRPTKRRL